MKNNKFLILGYICICICSCSTVRQLSDDDMRHLFLKGIMDTVQYETSLMISKVEDKNTEQLDKLKNINIQSEALKTRGQRIEANAKRSYQGEAKFQVLNRLQKISNETKGNDYKITELMRTSDSLSKHFKELDFYKITNILSDSIVNLEIDNYKKNHKNSKENEFAEYLEKNKVQIVDKILDQLRDKLKSISDTHISIDQKIEYIYVKRNSIAYSLKIEEANIRLQNHIWGTNHIYDFQSGSYSLDIEQKLLITEDIRRFIDSVFITIDRNVGNFHRDTMYNLTLAIYIDGFADSQGFKDKIIDSKTGQSIPDSTRNRILSQHRADNIMEIILDIYNSKIKQLSNQQIRYLDPIKYAVGHGEELPYYDGDYKPERNEDKRRRMIKLQCTFNIEIRENQNNYE
ncbi:MAG: hypothetical protein LBK58_06865 [Prevotellaceae bacterium]|jgi:hypothetical protein|nr:hypothetical protein [Prevotellaceae bacterium]